MGIADTELDEPFDMIKYCRVHEWEYSAWVGCMACMEDAADRRYDDMRETNP